MPAIDHRTRSIADLFNSNSKLSHALTNTSEKRAAFAMGNVINQFVARDTARKECL